MPITSFRELRVYKQAHELAMKIFEVSGGFPATEKYSLTDQIRRSSRSAAVNIAEGWGNCAYLSQNQHTIFLDSYESLGAQLFILHNQWRTLR